MTPDDAALVAALPGWAFAFVLVLSRVSAVVLLLPGIGESDLPAMLRAGLTPQGFRRTVLGAAHRAAGGPLTGGAALVEGASPCTAAGKRSPPAQATSSRPGRRRR